MLVGTRYSATAIAPHYDAIVVGSGMSGLTAAALMAKAGRRVLVLERHYTAGGFTHSYRRRGYQWDVGVHYVGEVHKPDSGLRRMFDAITDGQLQWAKMDDTYDRIIVGEEAYDFVAGASRFRDSLLQSFPGARSEIDEYLHRIRAVSRAIPAQFGPRFLPDLVQPLVGAPLRRAAGDPFSRTTASVLGECITDPQLAGVLTGQWGDYGLPPGRSSFGMHALVAQHYLSGANFPIGGAWRIADTIVPVIERAGGAVLVNAEVATILVSGNRAIGVRMANGDEIRGDRVISAAGLHTTYGRLVPEEVGQRHRMPERLSRLRRSASHLGLTLGIQGTTEELGLSQTNLWLYRDYDHDRSVARYLASPNTDFALNYLSFPSAKDPAWAANHPGKSTIDVITLAPYEWFQQWEGTPWRRRGSAYEDFKAEFTEALLADVYRHVPQVRGRIEVAELSTPLSTNEFVNADRGQIYGLEHSPQRFAQTWIKPRTPIKGLYLTGQDVLFCGVASAMMSGAMTATSVLGPAAIPVLAQVYGVSPRRLLAAIGR